MRDSTAKYLSAAHRIAYRVTGGRVGRRLVGNRMLLLSTVGRKSGKRHTVPLLYLEDGTSVIVIASWGGRDYPPHWYLNLQENPVVAVQIDDETWTGRAEELTGPKRDEWWDRVTTAYSGYEVYQERTDRLIPIIRISREA